MRMVDLIEKKKRGEVHNEEEISFLIIGYTQGQIPDYQMAAWSMAVYFQGLSSAEISLLTMAMAESGSKLDLSFLGKPAVDKHSTGGVGDKTTLVLGPLAAACGVPVAKMSGRGLGHTGGTIDKLESIPGFRAELTEEEFLQQVQRIGLAVTAQTGNLTPADRKLYALRDVTATVDSLPLIASSVMSKKIAAGASGIVLDVKYGDGAFLTEKSEAAELARIMVDIGNRLGRRTEALLSDMSQPLGRAVGNRLEVLEAIECLQNRGPEDLREVTEELAVRLLIVGEAAAGEDEARAKVRKAWQSGDAWRKFQEMVHSQDGDLGRLLAPSAAPVAIVREVTAERSGYVQALAAKNIGLAAMTLGAGRKVKESVIDPEAGVYLVRKAGEQVVQGETLCLLYSSCPEKFPKAEELVRKAYLVGDKRYVG